MLKVAKFIILFLISSNLCVASEEIASSVNDADIVKQAITEFMQTNQVPGVAVELYVNGEPQHYYFGYAKPDKKLPVTKQTIFEIGSLSKVMTAILLAQEIDAAQIQIDAPLKTYLPDISKSLDNVTLKNLATHTGGLAFSVPDTVTTPAELNQFLAQYTPNDKSNEKWIYSNLSIGLLGLAMENATHKNLNTLYRQRILAPLRMQQIGIMVPKTLQNNYAQGYDEHNEAVPALSLSLLPAGGQMKVSAADMQRFLSAAIGLPGTPERILYPIRLTQSVFVELPDARMQGLGWTIHPLDSRYMNDLLAGKHMTDIGPVNVLEMYKRPIYNGNMLIDKTGQTDGFRAYIAVIPNKKTGIVILANKKVQGPAIVQTARKILFTLNHIESESNKLTLN